MIFYQRLTGENWVSDQTWRWVGLAIWGSQPPAVMVTCDNYPGAVAAGLWGGPVGRNWGVLWGGGWASWLLGVGGHEQPVGEQVWSLTQFYSVDFSQSRMGVKKCVFNKHTIRVSVSCFWRCPWFCVVLEATHEARQGPLKGTVSDQKSLQGSET